MAVSEVYQLSLLYREIPLTQGKVALVDEEDYAYLSQFKWQYRAPSVRSCAGHEGYAVRRVENKWEGSKTLFMHRVIMHAPPGLEVDHRRIGSGLDNRRANLRLLPHAANVRNAHIRRDNTSGFRGVHWHQRTGKWQAQLRCKPKGYYLGLFSTAEEASVAYEAARERMGLLKADSDR